MEGQAEEAPSQVAMEQGHEGDLMHPGAQEAMHAAAHAAAASAGFPMDQQYAQPTPDQFQAGMVAQYRNRNLDSDYEYQLDSPEEAPAVKPKKPKRYSGLPKQKWTEPEEQALRQGVAKYGVGKWRLIQKDEDYGPILTNRSNVDLKDKWRNLNMDSIKNKKRDVAGDGGEGGLLDDDDFSGDGGRKRKKRAVGNGRNRAAGAEALQQAAAVAQEELQRALYAAQNTDHLGGGQMAALAHATRPYAMEDGRGPIPDDMVVAAIISLQDPTGSSPDSITHWIESHYGMTADFRKTIRGTLERMVDAGRLESVPGHEDLFRLGGVVRKLSEEGSMTWAHEGHEHPDDGDRTALEAAEAAARAVAEAEEAAALATRLMDAANRYEQQAQDFGHHHHPEGHDGQMEHAHAMQMEHGHYQGHEGHHEHQHHEHHHEHHHHEHHHQEDPTMYKQE